MNLPFIIPLVWGIIRCTRLLGMELAVRIMPPCSMANWIWGRPRDAPK